jgi:hypothetical protein
MIEKYINDGQNNYVALSGHKYTFFISNYPTNDGQKYTSIKISDSNDNSNDFVMRTSALKFMMDTLKQACENIVKISLDFIKVSQNNDIIKRLSSIEDSLKYYMVNNGMENNNHKVNISDVPTQEPIVNYDTTKSIDIPTQEPIVNYDTTKSIDVPFDPPFTTDLNTPESNTIIDAPKNETVINNALDHIHNNLNKDPKDKFKDKVLSHIKDAKNNKIDIKNLQSTIIESASLIFIKEDLTFENLSNYFYLTYSSFERVFKKLSLITNLHNYVSTKVPLFIFKCRLNQKYIEMTKEMNETLIDLYLEYRSKENGSDEEQYIYAALRYALAPFWSSYLSISDDVCNNRPEILSNIKTLAIMSLQENNIENKIDRFIYDNKLALEYKKDNVEDHFAQYCPTLFECLKEVNGNTPMEDVNMVKDIINQLKETFAYQEIIFKEWYDLNKLSDNFVKSVYTFNKSKLFNKETPLETLNEYHTNEILKKDVNNIRNEFKALSVMDIHDGELKKKSDILKEAPVSPPLKDEPIKTPDIEISNNETPSPEHVNEVINNSVNPLDFLI